jgi:hypothetical protein
MKRLIEVLSLVVLLAISFAKANEAASQATQPRSPETLPLMLDLKTFIRERFITNLYFYPLVGVQQYDGLPFQIEGRGWLYGRSEAERGNESPENYPDFIGISVGRRFEELHLLHASRWQEGEGKVIAIIRLNYSDGTSHERQIKYGAHVRDWQRMPSEENELMSDTNTKVVWRTMTPSQTLKSTIRLFKTRFDNPFPEKIVATMDFVSTRQLAAYDLVAATVAHHDSKRPLTPAVEPASPDREFNRKTTIRVLDQNGKPVAGALLAPGVTVDKATVIALPQYTSKQGEGVIRYPGMRTTSLSIRVEKASYQPQYLFWSAKKFGNATWQQAAEYIALMKSFVPETNTVILIPTNSSAALPGSSP